MNKIKTHIIENKIDYTGYLISLLLLIQMSSMDGYVFVGLCTLVISFIIFIIVAPIIFIIDFLHTLIVDLRLFKDTEKLTYLVAPTLIITMLTIITLLIIWSTGGLYI